MTEQRFYVSDGAHDGPTLRERAIPGTTSTVDRLVAAQTGWVGRGYEDLAFAVLARVLAPDEATVERVARALIAHAHSCSCCPTIDDQAAHPLARAVLAALVVSP